MFDLPFLPCGRPTVTEEDISAVCDVLRSGWLTNGPSVVRFESALADNFNNPNVASCSNGTTALHLAILALSIQSGDVIIVPSLSFLATANAGRYAGAEVIFSDVDPKTGLMRPEDFQRALEVAGDKIVKAVLPVHFAGQTADIISIHKIAKERNIAVIEDCSHALGTQYYDDDGKQYVVGSCKHSDMATFSFHPVKNIAAGEGGAVSANSQDLISRVFNFRNHGMIKNASDFTSVDLAFSSSGIPNPWYYEMQELSFNYRLSDINCALGESQLSRMEKIVSGRRKTVSSYDSYIAPLAPVISPLERARNCNPCWHLYVVLIDFQRLKIERAEFMSKLHKCGIGSQVHYIPIHRQPYYSAIKEFNLPGADQYYAQALSLPMFTGMEDGDAKRVADALAEVTHGAL